MAISTRSIARIVGFTLLLVAYGLLASTASAMVIRGGESYTVASDVSLEDDLYYVGKSFVLHGTTTGDLTTFDSEILLAGHVGGDTFAAGGTTELANGTFEGDVRIAGGVVSITESVIGEDLIVFGGTISIDKGTIIHGDVLAYGDYVRIDGTIEGNLEVHGRAIELKGYIAHNVNATAGESVSITDDGHIAGDFLYQAPREAFVSDTAHIDGESSFEQSAPSRDSGGAFRLFPLLSGFLTSVVAALLFMFLAPHLAGQVSTTVLSRGWLPILKGLLLLILWPIVGVILMVTLLGFIPGAILLAFYALMILMTLSCMPIVAGLVLARMTRQAEVIRWDWVVLGALGLLLISFIPVLGPLAKFVLFLATFDLLAVTLYTHTKGYLKDGRHGSDEQIQSRQVTAESPTTSEAAAPSPTHLNEHEAGQEHS